MLRARVVKSEHIESTKTDPVASSHSATLKHMPGQPGRREVDHVPSVLHGKQQ